MIDAQKRASRALLIAGIASVIFGLAGVAYNTVFLFADYSPLLQEIQNEVDPALFYRAFYVMSGICITFYMALLVVGVQLIRQRRRWAVGLLVIVVLEVLYYVGIGLLWRSPQYAMAVAAATGVSSGALSYQAITLFPIWGPWLALWAHRKMSHSTGSTVYEVPPTGR